MNHSPSISRRSAVLSHKSPSGDSSFLSAFHRCTILYVHIPTLTSISRVRCKLDAVTPTIKDDQSRREGKLGSARSCPRLHWWPCRVIVRSSRRSAIEMHPRERDIFARDTFIQMYFNPHLRTLAREALLHAQSLIQCRDAYHFVNKKNANIDTTLSFLRLRSNRWLSYYSVTNAGLLTAHVIRYTLTYTRVMPQYRILSEESERYHYWSR